VIEDVANRLPDHREFVSRLPSSSARQPDTAATVSFALTYGRGAA
jgi:hypothetical protein